MENYTVHVQVHSSCLQVNLSLIYEPPCLISQNIFFLIYFTPLFAISLYNLNCIFCELYRLSGEFVLSVRLLLFVCLLKF